MKDKAFWPVFVFWKGRLLINLNMTEIRHCSNLLMTGKQIKSLNYLWNIVNILSNWRQKRIHLFCKSWSLFLCVIKVWLYYADYTLHNNRRNSGGKTDFSYIKTLIFDLLFKWFLMPLILQTLSRPVSNPNMLLWKIALFQLHYILY